MDALPVKILFVDENYKLRYWNEADKSTGPADALGKDIRENMGPLVIESCCSPGRSVSLLNRSQF